MEELHVRLKLKRLRTALDVYDFDVDADIPEHCAPAAVSLFLADMLGLLNTVCRGNQDTSDTAAEKLSALVLSSKPVMLEKLSGGVGCTLRTAAFAVMLRCHRATPTSLSSNSLCSSNPYHSTLAWAASMDLKGNTSDEPWRLSDVLYATEALVCHWEALCKHLWSLPDAKHQFTSREAPLGRYLDFLWSQCARFVNMLDPSEVARFMDASSFTMPYAATDANSGATSHEVSLSPSTVSLMCEIWRHVEHERRAPFARTLLAAPEDADTRFLKVFEFEKNQLSVDKFREELRRRLAERYLMLGDAEIWRAQQNGKDPELDLVVGARMPLAVPGFLQTVSSAWTFEKMQGHPVVRDELYRLMVDSAFRNRGVDFSLCYFRPAGIPPAAAPRRNVFVVSRLAHGFVLVRCADAQSAHKTVITPPLPFAQIFVLWAAQTMSNATARQAVPEVHNILEKFSQ